MTKLIKYIKAEPKDLVVTSVNLERKQHEFIKVNRINLSELIRDTIQKMLDEVEENNNGN